jgi:hypothetical protein
MEGSDAQPSLIACVISYIFLQIILTKAPYCILQRGTAGIFHDSCHLNVFFMDRKRFSCHNGLCN